MLESDDAVGQMIADWLRPNWDDEDSLTLGETSDSSADKPGPNERGAVADASTPAVIMPLGETADAAHKVVEPDGTPNRKVG